MVPAPHELYGLGTQLPTDIPSALNLLFRKVIPHLYFTVMLSSTTRYDKLSAQWQKPASLRAGLPVVGDKLVDDLRAEMEKSRLLEAQVASLESMLHVMRLQAEQYNYEAISNEKRIHELEEQLVKEKLKSSSASLALEKLDDAVESIVVLEEQLEAQVRLRESTLAPEEDVAYLTVENALLREQLSLGSSHVIRPCKAPSTSSGSISELTAEVRAALAVTVEEIKDIKLVRRSIADVKSVVERKVEQDVTCLSYSVPEVSIYDGSYPSEELAYALVENAVLREKLCQ